MSDLMRKVQSVGEDPAYSVFRVHNGAGMHVLRSMFADGKSNAENIVLFSTSGTHGTYNTIEDAEKYLQGSTEDQIGTVTFTILHPRLVCMKYGVCEPQDAEDIAFLKSLRSSSHAALSCIGWAAL